MVPDIADPGMLNPKPAMGKQPESPKSSRGESKEENRVEFYLSSSRDQNFQQLCPSLKVASPGSFFPTGSLSRSSPYTKC